MLPFKTPLSETDLDILRDATKDEKITCMLFTPVYNIHNRWPIYTNTQIPLNAHRLHRQSLAHREQSYIPDQTVAFGSTVSFSLAPDGDWHQPPDIIYINLPAIKSNTPKSINEKAHTNLQN